MSNKYHLWISILIDEYESIISRELLQNGYTIGPMDTSASAVINKNRCLAYYITHPFKEAKAFEADIRAILEKNNIYYHSCIMGQNHNDFTFLWWGSNIEYPDKKQPPPIPTPKTPSPQDEQEIEDVVAHMNQILDSYSSKSFIAEEKKRLQEKRNNT